MPARANRVDCSRSWWVFVSAVMPLSDAISLFAAMSYGLMLVTALFMRGNQRHHPQIVETPVARISRRRANKKFGKAARDGPMKA